MSALNQQVGGSHYKDMPIQPMYFCTVNNLNGVTMNFIKYLLREKDDPILDLTKATHCLNFAEEFNGYMTAVLHCPHISVQAFIDVNGIHGHKAKALQFFFQRKWELCRDEVSLQLSRELDGEEVPF